MPTSEVQSALSSAFFDSLVGPFPNQATVSPNTVSLLLERYLPTVGHTETITLDDWVRLSPGVFGISVDFAKLCFELFCDALCENPTEDPATLPLLLWVYCSKHHYQSARMPTSSTDVAWPSSPGASPTSPGSKGSPRSPGPISPMPTASSGNGSSPRARAVQVESHDVERRVSFLASHLGILIQIIMLSLPSQWTQADGILKICASLKYILNIPSLEDQVKQAVHQVQEEEQSSISTTIAGKLLVTLRQRTAANSSPSFLESMEQDSLLASHGTVCNVSLNDGVFLPEQGTMLERNTIHITNCTNSHIFVPANVQFVRISGCLNTNIILGPVTRTVTIQHCEHCSISVAARRVRVRNAVRCKVFLHSPHRPFVTSDCHSLQLGPYNARMHNLTNMLMNGNLLGITNPFQHPIGINVDGDVVDELQDMHGVSLVHPSNFHPTSIPSAHQVNEESPCILPPEYLEALEEKHNAVIELRSTLANLGGDKEAFESINQTIQLQFRDWLFKTNKTVLIDEMFRRESVSAANNSSASSQ